MNLVPFLDVEDSAAETADVLLLPLPYDGTACYGRGTARAPKAIWQASQHIELWDEELDFDLASLRYHTASPVESTDDDSPESYLRSVTEASGRLHERRGLVVGVGGEHSLTPALVAGARSGRDDLSELTVVQFDAHSDLRDAYTGTPHSHACAMRRLVDRGARVIAVGIRSAEREEFEYGRSSGRVETFFAQQLATDTEMERRLLSRLAELQGDVYLTFDIDALEVHLCPGTGTPQPGGLTWWQAIKYLRRLQSENRERRLIGCDLVETVPQPHTQVNEFTAAKLLAKMIAYCCS